MLALDGAQAVGSFPVEHALRVAERARDKRLVVFLNDADLLVHGTDHFIEAARAVPDMLILYINTMVYPVVHAAAASCPPAPDAAYASTEIAFNIPYLALSCGAGYIARWTSLHTRRLVFSIADALNAVRLSVIEVLAPCLMYYAKYLSIKTSVDRPRHLAGVALDHGAALQDLDLRRNDAMIVGIFKDPGRGNRRTHEDAPAR